MKLLHEIAAPASPFSTPWIDAFLNRFDLSLRKTRYARRVVANKARCEFGISTRMRTPKIIIARLQGILLRPEYTGRQRCTSARMSLSRLLRPFTIPMSCTTPILATLALYAAETLCQRGKYIRLWVDYSTSSEG